ncbi:MAG: DUF6600 domain-containing protein [Stenotrophobium sp.]
MRAAQSCKTVHANLRRDWRPLLALLLGFCATPVFADDPPDRVARLSVIQGDVSFAPAGEDSFGDADVNRPLATGDRLLTGDGGRAELQLGGASIRIAQDSAFDFLNLDDQTAQIELTQGTLNLDVRRLDDGQSYEVDTPTVAFVVNQPGEYRIDLPQNGDATRVSVYSGAGTVYGANNASYAVAGRQSYRFGNSDLTDIVGLPLASADDFDQWCFDRDNLESSVAAQNYVAPDVVGASDLGQYGAWQDTGGYGNVWFPTTVAVGWAPYRYGHWAWVGPWGWTWIDDAPWGFAPFHYGRWVYVNNYWGWLPGPRYQRPVYAPALVAFYGGSHWGVAIGGGGPVGWCPLGPGEVYVPPYHVSHRYFTNVNVTNVTNINRTTINNYYNNTTVNNTQINNINYRYHNQPGAMTVVSHETFAQSRPVGRAQVPVDSAALAHATAMAAPQVAPTMQSLRPASANHARTAPTVFSRPVIAHAAPPPPAPSFAAREPLITRNNGRPLDNQQLRSLPVQAAARPVIVRSNAVREPQAAAHEPAAVDRSYSDNAARPFATQAPLPRAPAVREQAAPRQDEMPAAGFAERGQNAAGQSGAARVQERPALRGPPQGEPAARDNPRNVYESSHFAPHEQRSAATAPRESFDASPRGYSPPLTRGRMENAPNRSAEEGGFRGAPRYEVHTGSNVPQAAPHPAERPTPARQQRGSGEQRHEERR